MHFLNTEKQSMFANCMSDGINFQGPEGNLYIFCQKKIKKAAIDMLTRKKGYSWKSHKKQSVK